MGSLSTITDETVVRDFIYDVVNTEALVSGIPVRYDRVKQRTTEIEDTYAYVSTSHSGYEKTTLAHGIYRVDVELLCEVNTTHANIAKGEGFVLALQRKYLKQSSNASLVVSKTDSFTVPIENGLRHVVNIVFSYNIRI